MKITSYLFLVLLIAQACSNVQTTGPDTIDWQQLTSLRIYDSGTFPAGKDSHTVTDAEIGKMTFTEADLQQAKAVLVQADRLGDQNYLWKGHHFAVATFGDGSRHKLKISTYGGFFMDLADGCYYEFKGTARKTWDSFCDEQLARL